MQIDIDAIKNTSGIGKIMLDRIIENHKLNEEVKEYTSRYIINPELNVNDKLNLFNGDSVQLMNHIPDKCVDLILTDPPYGIDFKGSGMRKKSTQYYGHDGILNDKDNNMMLKKMVINAKRILKEDGHIYWFCNDKSIKEHLNILTPYFKLKNILVWDKMNHGVGDLLGSYGNRYEFILFLVNNKRKELNAIGDIKRHQDIISIPRISANKLIHPHQKPLELLEFLIKKSSKENDTVLDTFTGSGNTGIAALKLNRKFIGFELDKIFFDKAKNRIEEI